MMRLAFFIARTGQAIDRMIDACSGRYGFSHVELVFSDGACFSSSPIELTASGMTFGVRFRSIDFTAQPSNWVLRDLPTIPGGDEIAIRQWAEDCAKEEHGYDFAGVLHFVDPFIHPDPNDYFCSEVVLEALQSRGYFDGQVPANTSPNALAQIVGVPSAEKAAA